MHSRHGWGLVRAGRMKSAIPVDWRAAVWMAAVTIFASGVVKELDMLGVRVFHTSLHPSPLLTGSRYLVNTAA